MRSFLKPFILFLVGIWVSPLFCFTSFAQEIKYGKPDDEKLKFSLMSLKESAKKEIKGFDTRCANKLLTIT